MKSAFDKIAAGLNDAVAYVAGDTTRGQAHVPIDVKAVRGATRKTQADFARTYRLPVATVRDWEQNRRQPDAPARAYLSMIQADPTAVEKLLAKAGG